MKLLRQYFAELPGLTKFRTESEPLLRRFTAAGERRNDLVHGAIARLSAKDGAFLFLKIDVSAREHHAIRSVVLDDADWPTFRKELLYLGKAGQSLAQRVWDSLKQRTS